MKNSKQDNSAKHCQANANKQTSCVRDW